MTKFESLIEAVQWSGSNWHEMLAFAGGDVVSTDGSQLFANLGDVTVQVHNDDWLIRNARNRFSVMHPDEFALTYIEIPESELAEP